MDNDISVTQEIGGNKGQIAGRDINNYFSNGAIETQNISSFWDLPLNELYPHKAHFAKLINSARKAIFFSPAALICFGLFACSIFAVLFQIANFGKVSGMGKLILIWPVAFVVSVYFLRQKIDEYAPIIDEYNQELALLNKVIAHKKLSSR